MSPRRIAAGRAGAVRVAIALFAGTACLGAVAYAATATGGREIGIAGGQVAKGAPHRAAAPQDRDERVPRVRLIEVPAASSTATEAQFRFHVPPRAKEAEGPSSPADPGAPVPRRRFQCRLDGGRWSDCDSPHRLAGLAPGAHAFSVRALTRRDRPGPDVGHDWRVAARESVAGEEPAEGPPFSIEQTGTLAPLLPGDPAQQVALEIGNPNSASIEVTGLTVTVAGAPPACGVENFQLTASNASPEAPLVVPADGEVSLPSASISAPSISLLDLPVNQDACQGAELELALSGEARG